MTEVATELDISVLVGEMPAQGCEVEVHPNHPLHADGDEQYVRINKPCGHDNGIIVLCMKSVQALYARPNVYCLVDGCDWSLPPIEVVIVLGPANQ